MTLKEGMMLNYMAPAEEFVWNPQGNPYLIKTGDTLSLISKEVYATTNKWKLLWENNRPLIKNPNKIYAGFTIYYLENGREVANQNQKYTIQILQQTLAFSGGLLFMSDADACFMQHNQNHRAKKKQATLN